MPRTVLYRRGVYRSSVHPLPRRTPLPFAHPGEAAPTATVYLRNTRRSTAARVCQQVFHSEQQQHHRAAAQSQRVHRPALPLAYPGDEHRPATVHLRNVRRFAAGVVTRIVETKLAQARTIGLIQRQYRSAVPFAYPGEFDDPPAFTATVARAGKRQPGRNCFPQGWGAFDYSQQWRNRIPIAAHFSQTETPYTRTTLYRDVRRMLARAICAMEIQQRDAWPHVVTRKAPLPDFPDSSTRATGYPGLSARPDWHWRHWHRPKRQFRRQRRLTKPLMGIVVVPPFVFEGTLLGTLRIEPTYLIDEMRIEATYAGAIGINLEG